MGEDVLSKKGQLREAAECEKVHMVASVVANAGMAGVGRSAQSTESDGSYDTQPGCSTPPYAGTSATG